MDDRLRLRLRSQVELFRGSGAYESIFVERAFPVAETALLLCDVWDDHWCPHAAARVSEMVPTLNTTVRIARDQGIQIIHAPSDTLAFYADSPHRRRIQELPRIAPPDPLPLRDDEVPFPIDDSDGGCDTPPDARSLPPNTGVWTRQHPGIEITGEDVISDNGAEVYSLLQHQDRKTLIIAGVHTNMCVLGRSFGIRQMTRWGIQCILLRDLTDTMYSPTMRPYVNHFAGTELVVRHIERFWCPTAESSDLTAAPPFRFAGAP